MSNRIDNAAPPDAEAVARKRSRIRLRWTIGLPIAILPFLFGGMVMTEAGHGNYALIACVTFPLGMLVWFLLMKTDPPIAVFLVAITIATMFQWAYFGFVLDRLLAPSLAAPNRRKCVKCGYRLRGLKEPRCPECRTPFDPSLLVESKPEE